MPKPSTINSMPGMVAAIIATIFSAGAIGKEMGRKVSENSGKDDKKPKKYV